MRQAVSRVKVNLEGAQRKKRAAVGKETYVTENILSVQGHGYFSKHNSNPAVCSLCSG